MQHKVVVKNQLFYSTLHVYGHNILASINNKQEGIISSQWNPPPKIEYISWTKND